MDCPPREPTRQERFLRALAAARVFRTFGELANEHERVVILLADEIEKLQAELSRTRQRLWSPQIAQPHPSA